MCVCVWILYLSSHSHVIYYVIFYLIIQLLFIKKRVFHKSYVIICTLKHIFSHDSLTFFTLFVDFHSLCFTNDPLYSHDAFFPRLITPDFYAYDLQMFYKHGWFHMFLTRLNIYIFICQVYLPVFISNFTACWKALSYYKYNHVLKTWSHRFFRKGAQNHGEATIDPHPHPQNKQAQILRNIIICFANNYMFCRQRLRCAKVWILRTWFSNSSLDTYTALIIYIGGYYGNIR